MPNKQEAVAEENKQFLFFHKGNTLPTYLRTIRMAILPVTCLLAIGILAPQACVEAQEQENPQAFSSARVIAGTARERGMAYGKLYRDQIREFLDQEIYETFIGNPASKDELLQYATACGQVARQVCPMIVEEYEGVAEGADLMFEEVVLLNLHEELYHRGKLPDYSHCTAIAVAPSDTGDGRTYVGQTWDWMTSVAGKSSVLEWRRDDDPSVLAYGFPGMPMGAGMNSQGIALCWTSAALGAKGKLSPRVGVPSYLLIAHLLAQDDLESVIREAKRDKHAGWFTFVMADGNGNLVNIEGSPKGIAFERRRDRLARVGFGTRKMAGPANSKQPPKLHPRCQQMYALLQQTARNNDRETLQRYFTEREHEIVAWGNPRNKTIDVMVFDTQARTAYFTRGPEYHLEWREFSFSQPE